VPAPYPDAYVVPQAVARLHGLGQAPPGGHEPSLGLIDAALDVVTRPSHGGWRAAVSLRGPAL